MNWIKDSSRHAIGENLLFGRFVVGRVYHDTTVTRGDSLVYGATCELPGMIRNLGHYASIEAAKAHAERAAQAWLDGAKLKEGA